jgi:hypothetical protein
VNWPMGYRHSAYVCTRGQGSNLDHCIADMLPMYMYNGSHIIPQMVMEHI